MAEIHWDHSNFLKSTKTKALDGVEEVARTAMMTQARQDCPVGQYSDGRVGGTLRGSIGVERDDAKGVCYLGCGGPAKDYAYRQEMDRSLQHRGGQKAGFLRDSVQMHAGKLNAAIEKHIQQ
jgi:hypothetical protein